MKKLFISILLCAEIVYSSNSDKQSLESAFKRLTVSDQQFKQIESCQNQAKQIAVRVLHQSSQSEYSATFDKVAQYTQLEQDAQIEQDAQNKLYQEVEKERLAKWNNEKFGHWG